MVNVNGDIKQYLMNKKQKTFSQPRMCIYIYISESTSSWYYSVCVANGTSCQMALWVAIYISLKIITTKG